MFITARVKPVPDIGRPIRGVEAAYLALRPNQKANIRCYVNKLRIHGPTYDRDNCIVNVFGPTTHGMFGRLPWLTSSRVGAGCHLVFTRSRLLASEDMLAL